jgi:hypothetical protein
MRKTSAWTALVVAGLTLAPAMGAASQVAESGPMVKRGTDPVDLEERARSLFTNPERYDEAARLYARAADLRDAGDRMRVEDLMMAARLTFYDGSAAKARVLMERAADEALAAGDVIIAAHAFVDAAYLARDARENERVAELLNRAKMLAGSPLIAQKERENILSRVTQG